MKKLLYRVGKKDTLFSIARRFGVPESLIVADNNLKAPVYEGQIVLINILDGCLYPVKPSDTLAGISKKFNLSVEEIKARNKIDYVFYGITIWV